MYKHLGGTMVVSYVYTAEKVESQKASEPISELHFF